MCWGWGGDYRPTILCVFLSCSIWPLNCCKNHNGGVISSSKDSCIKMRSGRPSNLFAPSCPMHKDGNWNVTRCCSIMSATEMPEVQPAIWSHFFMECLFFHCQEAFLCSTQFLQLQPKLPPLESRKFRINHKINGLII